MSDELWTFRECAALWCYWTVLGLMSGMAVRLVVEHAFGSP